MKIKILIISLLLTSCAQSKPRTSPMFSNIFDKSYKEIEFRENGFFENYQESLTQWIDKDGNLVKQYTRSERQENLTLYIPLISFFFSRDYDNFEIIATFDKRDNVIDIKSFYNIANIDSKAFCNFATSGCIKKVK